MPAIKLAILSHGPKAYSTRRLKEAALQRGHEVKVLDSEVCYRPATGRTGSVLSAKTSL